MFLYKVICHGVNLDHPDYVVCAETINRAFEICQKDVRTTFDESIGECNIVKIGVVTADIDHLYKADTILMKGN